MFVIEVYKVYPLGWQPGSVKLIHINLITFTQ